MDAVPDSSSIELPTKRRRPTEKSRVGAAYPRKRAVAACQLCRARKIKCNNARPSCSSCLAASATCVFEDSKDHSAFDPASILILDRLDQVLARLDHPPATPSAPSAPSPSTFSLISRASEARSASETERTPHLDKLRIPSGQTTVDSVLRWPILGGRYPSDYITDPVFAAEDPNEDLQNGEVGVRSSRRSQPIPSGTNHDSIPELIELFLDFVHSKNPIADVDTLRSHARRVYEEGPQWDAESCLVLIACALGSLARPWKSGISHNGQTSLERDNSILCSGEGYYNLACRRFGFLKDGILGAQCHFLAGVYLMCTMKPLAAWSKFHSASRSYHMYLEFQAHRIRRSETPTVMHNRQSLENSLYWSCYKSECELRVEINVSHSSLADLRYPNSHPSPPQAYEGNLVTLRNHFASDRQAQSSGPSFGPKEEEEGWFYYLTEITLRRISNSVLATFYSNDYTCWASEQIPIMTRVADGFKQQLHEWYARVPAPIRYDEDEFPSDELPYLVRSRMLETQLYIHQPFLYYAIHNPDTIHRDIVRPLAEEAVRYSFLYIKDEPIPHRHHGCWLGIRSSIAACLFVLAAVQSNTVSVRVDWEEEVNAYIERLGFWSDEIPWISNAIQVLRDYSKT